MPRNDPIRQSPGADPGAGSRPEGDTGHHVQARERQRQEIQEATRRDSEPILAELAEAGFPFSHISELADTRGDYRQAIPILLRWLPRTTNPRVKEMIVRALSVPAARRTAAPEMMITEFQQTPPASGLKWAIGNALEVLADDRVYDQVVELARDRHHGKSREMVVAALGNMKNPRAADILIDLLEDEAVAGHAVWGLGKLKAKSAKSQIERFLSHPKPWVRNEAKRALAKIDKAK